MTSINQSLAFEVLKTFSLFEYGLKKIGYRASGKYKIAEVDWETWYNENKAVVIQPYGENFSEYVRYITSNPAKKQVIDKNGELDWKVVSLSQKQKNKVARLAQLVKTVRNNFFHGGKYYRVEFDEPTRDQNLLRSANAILRAIIEMDPRLKSVVSEAEDSFFDFRIQKGSQSGADFRR